MAQYMDCVSTYRHHWNDLNVADKQQLKNVCMEIIDKVGSLSFILFFPHKWLYLFTGLFLHFFLNFTH